MKNAALIILGLGASFCFGYFFKTIFAKQTEPETKIEQPNIPTNKEKEGHLKLGAFSMSLSVKDLKASKEFYESLGFTTFASEMKNNYLIMKNENALIGLFQGMFKGNILTFNPGWDENAKNIDKFNDIREIQKQLKSKGIKLTAEADEKTTGPASLMTIDPDSNIILIDQHR